MSQPISPHCIYTILHTLKLDERYRGDRKGKFTENTKWITGMKLFLKAKKDKEIMPIIFAAADVGGSLIYQAILEGIEINEPESTTTYEFSQLRPLVDKPSKSSLRLKSTNRPLSNDYIRPYAICFTPSYVK